MHLLKKIPIIVEIAVLMFGVFIFAMPAQADSCGCDKVSIDTTYVTAVAECFPNLSSNDCINKTDELNRINSNYNVYTWLCKPYLDNSCTKVSGAKTTDTGSIFNNCWTKEQCNSAKGDFDEDRSDSSNCTAPSARCFVKTPDINLQIPIPGYGSVVSGGFPGYLAAFYKFFIAMLAVASVVMVMWGGFKRIMAAGSPERIKDANDAIISAITGLVLALISYTLLNLVNPKLVNFTRLNMDIVKTELYGKWCPDPDPLDSSIHYKCGVKESINGQSCIGSSCESGKGGCVRVGNTGISEEDYECLNPNEACMAINMDIAKSIYGLPDWGDSTIQSFTNFCNQFSYRVQKCDSGLKQGDICTSDADCGGVTNSCALYLNACYPNWNAVFMGKPCNDNIQSLWVNEIIQTCSQFSDCDSFEPKMALCYYDVCKKDCKVSKFGAHCVSKLEE